MRETGETRVTHKMDAAPAARERVLAAAAEAFMHSGYSATTIEDISKLVGATKGLVYYHFRSKFDIFLAIYEEGMADLRRKVEPFAETDGPGKDRLIAMANAHVHNLMTHLAYHRVVQQAVRGQSSPSIKARHRDALLALNELRKDYERLFQQVLADGIADGSLHQMDTFLASRTLLSSLNAVDNWYQQDPTQSKSEVYMLSEQIVGLLINGYTAK